jgi:hypothetical protein
MAGDCDESFEAVGEGKGKKAARKKALQTADNECEEPCSKAVYLKRVRVKWIDEAKGLYEFTGLYKCVKGE